MALAEVGSKEGSRTEEKRLKHLWWGWIGDPKARQKEFTETFKKVLKVGGMILLGGVTCMVGAILSGIGILWSLTYAAVFIGLLFTVIPAIYLRRGTYAVAWNEYLEGPGKKRWLDDGLLESTIKDQLYLNKFEYERARAAGYHLHLKLANGLLIYVVTVSLGHGVTMEIRIDGISEANAEEAKRLRRALAEIPITSTESTGRQDLAVALTD